MKPKATSTKPKAKTPAKKRHVIIRAHSAGVFAGYLKRKIRDEVTLTDARRLWKWDGAATISQLAMEGVTAPQNCKFPRAVDEITILGVIEIIPTTKAARDSINSVPVWKR